MIAEVFSLFRKVLAGLVVLYCATISSQAVTLVDHGATVTMANGIVSTVIQKSNGRVTDLRKGGPNLLANGGQIYFDANGSVDGGSSVYVPFAADAFRVVTNTMEWVEVLLMATNFTGFHTELHYVLREGSSGLDVFTVWRHGPGDPAAVLDQSRMVIRCDPNLFTRAFSSPQKTGQMIEPALLSSSLPMIMDATYKLPLVSSYTNETGQTDDGHPVYTKYDWSDYMENHTVHGVAGNGFGIWMLMGSVEYFNGGPTKANQMVHGTETTPVVLWVFQGQHFGASPIEMDADESWSKINGPYFIYVNSGTNAAELWADAQARAAAEVEAWPLAWMDHPDYPVERGTVSGRLRVAGQSTSNALMVLAQPGEYWQLQEGTGYQFWSRAGADGSFTIPKVRSGTYSLFAQVPGVVGIMERADVVVTAETTNDLGTIDWAPPRHERWLFRLGTPDLSAAEFRFGSEMRQYGFWWRYLEERGTNDLDFVVGTSAASNDWYYALSLLPIEITATNGIWVSPRWNIHFTVDEIPPAPARLSVELAGAIQRCAFYVFVNGVNICPDPVSGISTVNDAGIYRSATRSALQQRFELTFDPNLLVVGTNTISFTVRGTGGRGNPWSGTKPVYPNAGIMFDCIQLEAGAPMTNAAPRFMRVEDSATGLIMNGEGGFPGGAFYLLATTNLALSGWESVLTGEFDGAGRFAITNDTDREQEFYRLEIF